MVTSAKIRQTADAAFEKAENLEQIAETTMKAAQKAYEEAKAKMEAAQRDWLTARRMAANLYRESDQLYAQAEAMEHDKMMSDRSVHQLALRKAEAKMLGLRIDLASAGNAGGREDNRAEIDRIMKTLRSKVDAILQSYSMAMNDCEDLVYEDDRSDAVQDCRVEVGDAFAGRLQRVIDATRPKLRKLGVTQFVNELDIPEEFDITE